MASVSGRAHVLIVDDDLAVVDVMATYLEHEGYTVDIATDGPSALAAAEGRQPDLVVLDVTLPGMDGFGVLRLLRLQSAMPVILLTGRGEEADRVMGLEAGADDYVVKPFSPRELTARVAAVLRRTAPVLPSVLRAGPLLLDVSARRLLVDDGEVVLTAKEFDLLAFFMTNPQKAFRRSELLEAVWGYSIGDASTVTVHVRHLREKVEADASAPQLIQTVWSVGYRFAPPPAGR